MIFRYECVKGNLDGNYCFNKECDLYPSDKECPDIRPQGNESVTTDWVISFNSTTESTLSTECGRIEIPNLRSLINCTETTIDPTTEATIDKTTSYTTEDINHESSTSVGILLKCVVISLKCVVSLECIVISLECVDFDTEVY
jgi:hypothetical protein